MGPYRPAAFVCPSRPSLNLGFNSLYFVSYISACSHTSPPVSGDIQLFLYRAVFIPVLNAHIDGVAVPLKLAFVLKN